MIQATIGPVTLKQRIQILDILRGFALLGILVVNIVDDYRFAVPNTSPGFNELNSWTTQLVHALAEGSFYPIFAFLFGIGFAIWMDKSMKKNGGPVRFIWRSLILLSLACFFYIFIEERNILIRYSILSIPLLLFYKAGPKTLLTAGLIFLILAVFYGPFRLLIDKKKSPQEIALIKIARAPIDSAWALAERRQDFLSFSKARLMSLPNQLKSVYTFKHWSLSIIFCIFLLGVYSWRKGLFTAIEKHAVFWKRIFWGGLIIGAGGNLVYLISWGLGFKKILIPDWETLNYLITIANPALSFFYISSLVLFYQKLNGRRNVLFDALKDTGRIPLTNYFTQCIAMALLMFPYGLGLDGKLYSQYLVLIAVLIFILQVIFSVFWMKYFLYGPMEWLWRSLTYLKFQPMRIENSNKETNITK
jgi:uncharacterized protein